MNKRDLTDLMARYRKALTRHTPKATGGPKERALFLCGEIERHLVDGRFVQAVRKLGIVQHLLLTAKVFSPVEIADQSRAVDAGEAPKPPGLRAVPCRMYVDVLVRLGVAGTPLLHFHRTHWIPELALGNHDVVLGFPDFDPAGLADTYGIHALLMVQQVEFDYADCSFGVYLESITVHPRWNSAEGVGQLVKSLTAAGWTLPEAFHDWPQRWQEYADRVEKTDPAETADAPYLPEDDDEGDDYGYTEEED